jgi:hypothetical protein
MTKRPLKITFAEMRESVARGILVYCAGYRCSRSAVTAGRHCLFQGIRVGALVEAP